MLLHWFASHTAVIQREEIHLNQKISLTRGDYGFHEYVNDISNANARKPTFPELSHNMNRSYYTLGNLNHASQLPWYVRQDHDNSQGHPLGNTDRLVIRVHKNDPYIVDEVYISQHSKDRNLGIRYDPQNTFRVDPFLLKQIQGLSHTETCNQNDPRASLSALEYWKHQKRVSELQSVHPPTRGLGWFMSLAGYNVTDRLTRFSQSFFCSTSKIHGNSHSRDTKPKCKQHNRIKLEMKSTSNGYARISWSGIPEYILKMESSVGLSKDNVYPLDRRPYGAIDTNWVVNPGLQVKLIIHDRVAWMGPEFNDANGVLPTNIQGHNASLQLFTKDGYACARLFIKKSCVKNWQVVFENSWVGFYKSSLDENRSYKKYQWVRKFEKNSGQDFSDDYDIFEYKSGLAIQPGVQLRFLKNKGYLNEKARTEPWEGVINPDAQS
ncbi:uncharacterized protein LOC118817133 [Colossoma macropomum]|uniref:uncharacterized protein LOC118817133 n=1 Tax=Colossoma macropomum TaxID=42526 RepID=UPI0018642107|nr:uncharacterized protein LOC118817133 [Colossoma macropomum]